MAIDPRATTLLDLDFCNFRRLETALEKDQAWKKVAEFVGIFDLNEIRSLSMTPSPASSLLHKLGTILLSLEVLIHILKECCLYDALLILTEPEPMHIIHQPTSILETKDKLPIKIGDPLELQFSVTGIPPPKFQWFKDDQILEDQTATVLHYEHFEPDMEGEYFCTATQECDEFMDEINSDIIKVETLPLACTLLETLDEVVYLHEGSALVLTIKVLAYPKADFQWLHANTVLENETKNVLFIRKVTKNHGGQYRCFISNKASEIIVKTNVIIYEENKLKVYKEPVANKIALLIANSDYKEQESLACPSNDVSTIAKILQTLGFKTICLQNLNLRELKIAIELFADFIDKESFAFFYYAGHGFTMGDKFLLPVDSPDASNVKKADAVPESLILQKVLHKNPVLFVFLLDMCLKSPNVEENPAIYKEIQHPHTFTPNRNLIKGYSTTNNLVSYEREGSENGMYVNILKKYLGKNLPIFTILGNVNEEISVECPEQMPDISRITAQEFYLNIPLKGFFQDENKNYASLKIKEDEACINGARVRLHSHKEVFNNVFDITISSADSVEYILNSTTVSVEEIIETDKITLRVVDLQKLGDVPFSLQLKINETDFEIVKYFEIGNIFLDI